MEVLQKKNSGLTRTLPLRFLDPPGFRPVSNRVTYPDGVLAPVYRRQMSLRLKLSPALLELISEDDIDNPDMTVESVDNLGVRGLRGFTDKNIDHSILIFIDPKRLVVIVGKVRMSQLADREEYVGQLIPMLHLREVQ